MKLAAKIATYYLGFLTILVVVMVVFGIVKITWQTPGLLIPESVVIALIIAGVYGE
jgi:hypothetical protein